MVWRLSVRGGRWHQQVLVFRPPSSRPAAPPSHHHTQLYGHAAPKPLQLMIDEKSIFFYKCCDEIKFSAFLFCSVKRFIIGNAVAISL